MFHGARTEAALEYGDEAVTIKSIWVSWQQLLPEVRLSLQGLGGKFLICLEVAMVAAPTDPFHVTHVGMQT